MIRYKNRTFEEYSICPATGDIFDTKTGEVHPVKIYGDRPCFKGMSVHQIMAHTFYGFKPGYDVHHLDENKLNNSLSNLVYLTHSEHARMHNEDKKFSTETRVKLSAAMKGKKLSEEHKAKLSAAMKGKKLSEETRAKLSAVMKDKKRGPFSEEHKAKLSAAHKGKPRSEEIRLKISATMKGKKQGNKSK